MNGEEKQIKMNWNVLFEGKKSTELQQKDKHSSEREEEEKTDRRTENKVKKSKKGRHIDRTKIKTDKQISY